jgi:predicted nucleic acid-binding protein
MNYVDWTPQLPIDPPAYLDANVLVGAIVNTHRLYPSCVQLIGQLLTSKINILISPVSMSECLWATAKLAYCQLTNSRPHANWNKTIYLRWCERIFVSYEGWITAVSSMTKDWSNAGVPIEVVPKTQALWENVVGLAPTFMRQLKLSPADAIHLAFAQTHAKTFITADSDYEIIRNTPPTGELTVIHLAA